MRRRNRALAVVLTAAVIIITAQMARAETTRLVAPSSDIPAVATTGDETTPSDMSITVTTTGKPTTTVDYSATDEYGSTIYAPTTTTTKAPTTTTKKTKYTPPPFQVNPAHPEDTDTREPGYRPIPDFFVAKTDEHGNKITVFEPETTTTEVPTTTEVTSTQEESGEDIIVSPDEAEGPKINWAVVFGAGAALLAALVGVIIMLAKGRKGEDDYINEEK